MIDHFGDGRSLRYVGGDRDRAAAHVLDLLYDCLGIIGAFPIVDRNRSTGFGERDGNSSPDATGRARHQGNVAG